MRPISISASSAGLFQWNSPVPYLFGGLLLVFGVIAITLLFLACCYNNSSSEYIGDEEKEEKSSKTMELEADSEPKVVVIMAGDDQPTYIAKPSLVSI
ncbi:hypothetical protein EZV62_024090 [Acer yangbiense]|uniref:Protein GLUTAMINE DUMPER 4 n=1 Tax=Acer yangbiense TaxID=1000413 RepID=A0A5C7H5R1_9ROSI|nr:hypothetical protein EZV62_024090 [Acer yangbiense]